MSGDEHERQGADGRDEVRYRQLLDELFGARRAGVVLGLERMRAVLAALGDPQDQLGTIVHVAGTNGKGSTVAMLAAMLAAHGLKVAVYTSPHLATVRERIVIAGEMIGRAELLAAADRVSASAARQGLALTFFEQITAIALVAMAAARPDATVLEVGLGGRLDATNVVTSAVAVVTGVALDHQAMLGDRLELIAVEKAGIFRRGVPAVIGRSGEEEAVPVLEACAAAAGAAPVLVVSEVDVAAVPGELALRGAHQRRNAATALAALRLLVERGVIGDDAAARARGLGAARHPGRFEEVARQPRVIVDGAHNPHGAAALAQAIGDELEAGRLPAPRVLVVAVSSDKDVAGIVGPLLPHFSAVIATAYGQERALAASALAARIAALREAAPQALREALMQMTLEVAAAAPEALARARQLAGEGGAVVVAGSLFLVGEARVHLLGGEVDPVRLSDPSGKGAAP